MISYRKIWEDHYQACLLPGIEIHHIDGNRNNNSIDNLLAVTIEEHYNIHYLQEDWAACLLISERINISYDRVCEVAKKQAAKRLANGWVHPNKGKKCPHISEIVANVWSRRTAEEKRDIAMKGVATREDNGWTPKKGPRRKKPCSVCSKLIASNNLWRHEKVCSVSTHT